MNDDNVAYDAFSPSFLEDSQRRQAASSLIGSVDEDPEKAARAVELGQATGADPSLIHGDLEHFEQQQKVKVNNQLVADNHFLQGYLNSHPLAASLSHDDLGQLDAASQEIAKLPDVGPSAARRAVDAFKEGFGEVSDKAFLTDPFIKKPSDIDYAIRNPIYSSVVMGLGDLVAIPLVAAGKTFSGITSVINEFGGREAAAMFEYGLMRGDINAPGTGSHADFAQIGQSIKAAGPWLRAGKDIPTGIDPTLDKMKVQSAKESIDTLSDAVAESVKSATRERSAEFYTNFARQHVGDQEIGISADKIREMYGDKAPLSDDNLLGWIPNLSDRLANAEATGGDVRVPLAEMLGHIDPEVFKELKDHIRVRPDGITLEEGKNLESPKPPTEMPPPEVYHGTVANFNEFSKDKLGSATGAPSAKEGFFFTDNPMVAKSYGTDYSWYDESPIGRFLNKATGGGYEKANEALLKRIGAPSAKRPGQVLSATLDAKNPFVHDFGGEEIRDKSFYDIMQQAKAAGHDSVLFKNTIDEGFGPGGEKPSNVWAVFDPKQIKITGRIEGSIITEPLPLLRGHAALEPMFSVGDRKVKLERIKDEQVEGPFGRDAGFHNFDIVGNDGKPLGYVNLSEAKDGKQLYIEMIQAGPKSARYGYSLDPNFLGPALVRDLYRQLKAEFPKAFGPDGLGVTGHRVSGAREKAGTYEAKHAMPVIKWEEVNDPTKWQSVHEKWQEIQKGVFGEPIEMTPEKQKVVDAVNQVLDRIVLKGVGTEGFEKIQTIEGDRVGGVYTRYEDAAPWISWSLGSPNPIATVKHEAVHFLRDTGRITPDEWSILSRAARSQDWVSAHNINERFDAAKLTNEGKIEESVADQYKKWEAKPEYDTPIGKIFGKIKEIIDALRAKMREVFGSENWEDIFKKIDSGEVGRREGEVGSRSDALKFEEGDVPDIGGKEAERLKNRISELVGELSVAKGQGFDIKGEDFKSQASELKEARATLRSMISGTFGNTLKEHIAYMQLIIDRRDSDLAASTKSALEYQRKTQTKEWKANRTEMRDEVREEVEGRSDVAVDQLMTSEKVKFHPDALTPEQREALPKEYIQKKDGVAPDDLAGYFGFASGDALVERLAMITADRKAADMSSREWANHLIDSETDRRMEEKYGNLDQRVLQEAKDQAISENGLNILDQETVFLSWLAGEKLGLSKVEVRSELKKIFDKTPIGSISTDEYLRAAGKAGREVEQRLLEEDYQGALRAKQRQSHAMIMASYAKQYEKSRKSFDRTAKTFQKREVASVPQEWTNWIHDILQRTGNRVNRSVQDLAENIDRQPEKTLRDFVEAKEAETFGKRETPVADFLLDPNFRQNMDKLTAQQFAGLKESIDVLAKQGRDEKKVYAAGEAADRDEVVKEMREKIKIFPQQLLPDERNWLQEKGEDPKKFTAGLTAIPTLMRRWERADPRGIFSRYIAYPLRRADNAESVLQRETSRLLREVGELKDPDKLVESPFPDPKTRTEENPDGTRWNGFARRHVLGMLAHAGNRSNWRVLAKGYSVDPEALMGWLIRNTTKEDWAQAQRRGDLVFKPLIDKADISYEHTTGATVEKIPLEPISNAHGDFAGWYHPLDADPLRKEVWVKQENGTWQRNSTGKQDSVQDKYGNNYATTANGYTRKRSGAVYPLDLDITAMNGTINQMIHDIAYREPLLETQKILRNRTFQNEVDNHYGVHYKDLLMPWLQDLAGQKSIPDATWKWAGEWSEYLRQNVISTYIGGNIYTAFKHGPTALVMSSRTVGTRAFLPEFGKQLMERLAGDPLRKALEVVGADHYANAVKGLYARSPDLGLTMSEYAMKHSEELQRRERHWLDTIRGETKVQIGEPTLRERVIEKSSWLVAQSDMLSAKPTWIAEYNKRIAEGISHGESIDLADDAVVRAHGSTGRSNQPALVRGGGPVHGWLTSVYGFMGARMQRMIEIGHQLNDMHQLGKEGELKEAAKRIPKLLTDVMSFAIWPIVVEEAVMAMNTEDHRTTGTKLVSAMTLGMSSSVLYLRDLVHGLSGGHEPGVGLLSSAGHDMATGIKDLMKGREAFNKQHAGKTVGDILTMLGEVKGVSPKVIGNASRFGIDLVNKQQHPKTGMDYFRGITRGTMERRKEK